MVRTLLTIPKTAKRGEVIELRVLVQHPMETGFRRGSDGAILPRDLIRKFSARFIDTNIVASPTGDGTLIFSANLYAAIAANPYLSFHFRASASGKFVFVWEGDSGLLHREESTLLVT
jgi:sulfur-oxidizing protein SoxZ